MNSWQMGAHPSRCLILGKQSRENREVSWNYLFLVRDACQISCSRLGWASASLPALSYRSSFSDWSPGPQHSLSCFVPSLPCPTAGGSPLPPALLCLFLSLQLRSCQLVTRTERSLLLHFVQQPLHTPKFQEPGYVSKMWGTFWMSGYPYKEPMLCQNRL